MPPTCSACNAARAQILRPKNHDRLCAQCFLLAFETEIHHTIASNALFQPGERIAIGASGGKDSTVLASVLCTLNRRYNYGVSLHLLSIDEGISGYRDDSLETVKRNAVQYGLPLTILGYKELYGWTMDEVVRQVGRKGNCTYCGVFRRQALDRGAARLGVGHVVTGHNADDVAETVMMNLLRGDLPRLSRTTSIVTSSPAAANPSHSPDGISHTNIKRSKPLKYAYEKEIVLYAHYKNLDYFSTECIYSPEAFRGSARALIKNLERVRPSAILDIVRSGEDMAKLIPSTDKSCTNPCNSHASLVPVDVDEGEGGCGNAGGRSAGGEMAIMEKNLVKDEETAKKGLEVEITTESIHPADMIQAHRVVDSKKSKGKRPKGIATTPKKHAKRTLGQCERCGYISSQPICKACVLLEGLNKNRPKAVIAINKAEVGRSQARAEMITENGLTE